MASQLETGGLCLAQTWNRLQTSATSHNSTKLCRKILEWVWLSPASTTGSSSDLGFGRNLTLICAQSRPDFLSRELAWRNKIRNWRKLACFFRGKSGKKVIAKHSTILDLFKFQWLCNLPGWSMLGLDPIPVYSNHPFTGHSLTKYRRKRGPLIPMCVYLSIHIEFLINASTDFSDSGCLFHQTHHLEMACTLHAASWTDGERVELHFFKSNSIQRRKDLGANILPCKHSTNKSLNFWGSLMDRASDHVVKPRKFPFNPDQWSIREP